MNRGRQIDKINRRARAVHAIEKELDRQDGAYAIPENLTLPEWLVVIADGFADVTQQVRVQHFEVNDPDGAQDMRYSIACLGAACLAWIEAIEEYLERINS